MTTEFGRRVKAARTHARLTQKQLAARAEMSQSNLSELETVAHESGRTLQLADACGVNAHWLATGRGEMLPSTTAVRTGEPPPKWAGKGSSRETHPVSSPSLKDQLRVSELTIGPDLTTWASILNDPIPQRFNLALRDDAMAIDDPPSMRAGNIATFVATSAAAPGQTVLLLDGAGNAYIRRYVEKTPTHWLAVARNSAYQTLDSHVDRLKIIAVQVGVFWG